MHKSLRFHGLPLLGYTLITLFVFSAVLPDFAHSIPGGGDAPHFLWQQWYNKYALLDRRTLPFVTNLIYYPLQNVPVISETIYNEILMLPLLIATTITIQYNLLVLASFILSGYGMYLLTVQVTKQQAISFVSGLLFAFCSYRLMRALGHLSLLSTQWTPFLFLAALLAWQRPTIGTGLRMGLFAALVVLATPYHVGLVLFPAGLVLAPYLLLYQRRRLRERAVWTMAMAAAALFLVGIAPVLAHYATLSNATYAVAGGLVEGARADSADLLAWLLPPAHNPIWGRWTSGIYRSFASPNLIETTVFVGIIPLLLAAFSIVWRKRLPRGAGYWQALALLAVLLSFGPVLHVFGRELIEPMPYAWFSRLPGFYLFRIPSRFAITAAIPIYLLAAMVFAEMSTHWTARRTYTLLVPGAALITINMVTAFPYPASDTTLPPYIDRIAATEGNGAVLSLPAGEFFFPDFAIGFLGEINWAMYYQSGHGKPLISGMMARRPAELFVPEQTLPFARRFFINDPLLRYVQFPSPQIMPPNLWPEDIRFGDELLHDEGIAHAVVKCRNPTYPKCPQAFTLLTLALGIPLEANKGAYDFAVGQPHTRELPDFLATAQLAGMDGTGTWMAVQDGHLLPVDAASVLSVTLPLDGLWRLTGEWRGEAQSSAQLTLDGAAAPWRFVDAAPSDPWFDWPPRRYFEATVPLEAGVHRLEVAAPSAYAAGAPDAALLALANLNVRLKEAKPANAGAAAAPLATFDEESGRRWELASATLLPIVLGTAQQPASYWLVTRWEGEGVAALAHGEGGLPLLAVELRSANGQATRQVTTRLGSQAAWDADATSAMVAVELPAAAFPDGRPQVRLWLEDDLRAEGDDRLAITTADTTTDDALLLSVASDELAPLTIAPVTIAPMMIAPVQVQDVRANEAAQMQFSSASEGRTYELLDVYIMHAEADAPYQLVSVWNRTVEDDMTTTRTQPEPVEIFVYAEEGDGTLAMVGSHALGFHNFTALGGTRIYDLLMLQLPPSKSEGAKVRMGIWNPATGERYVATGSQRIDHDERLKLGTVGDLLRVFAPLQP